MWGPFGQRSLFYPGISILSSIHIFFMNRTSFCLLGYKKYLFCQLKDNLFYATLCIASPFFTNLLINILYSLLMSV